ncbi:MAG: HD domain-containing protein, partial [Candidatus Gracilibacteria bacterium]
MNNLSKIKEFAEKHLSDNSDSAHNMEHVMRVYNLAITLSKNEKVDLNVIKIAILLHDIGKEGYGGKADHAIESAKLAKPFLQKLNLSQNKIDHILDCIISHRYRSEEKPKTLEAKIVF